MSDYQTRQTLLQRISSGGDEQSWEEFVHYYQTFIYIVCKKITGDSKCLPCQYQNLYKDVKKGHRIFIDDGKIELIVKSSMEG